MINNEEKEIIKKFLNIFFKNLKKDKYILFINLSDFRIFFDEYFPETKKEDTRSLIKNFIKKYPDIFIYYGISLDHKELLYNGRYIYTYYDRKYVLL
jgi:hypothetical protein